MNIVIIADFCGNFKDEKSQNRFQYLANLLCKEHDVEIITSDFMHGPKTPFAEKLNNLPFNVTMLHEPAYSKNISVKRLISHMKWGKNVNAYLKTRKKPDLIYVAMPTLYAASAAAKYCEKQNVHFIIDIQDLWPEAFKMALNIPVISDIIFWPMKVLADKAYSRADSIFAVSHTYVDRALSVNKKCKSGEAVYLGTNLDIFDENVRNNSPALIKDEKELWLGYCGSLGASYDIPCVLKALKIIKDSCSEVPRFIVMGDGARKQEFMDLAEELSIDAVFTGRLSYDIMCATVKECDMVINPITKGSAASIINKHADYAAAGLPVLNTQESQEYRDLVETYNMGINCINSDADDLAEKMKYLIDHEDERLEMGKNARRCAEEKFDRKNSYRAIFECIVE